jgi:general secretion pathway protein H
MPIFDCPTYRSRRSQGFTLIEILVVLFVVTIMTGLTVTRLPVFAQNSDLDLESRRLELLFNMAHNEAIADSAEFGFKLAKDGYQFMRFDDGTQSWREAQSPFQYRSLPDAFELRLRADNDGFKLLGESLPPILILSSGETTPFTLTLASKINSAKRVFSADGYGEFTWQEDSTR